MSSPTSRFVTTCQQLLVLGVICAVLTPAANIVSLDIVAPGESAPSAAPDPLSSAAEFAAYTRAAETPTEVPDQVVDPVVKEVALTAPKGARIAPGALKARTKVAGGKQRVISTPQKVTGYGAVGLTWQHGEVIPDDQITFKVRTQDQGNWSGWTTMQYHDEHGPDPDSVEGQRARPGTDELLVGDVDNVQVKIATTGASPTDLKLAVIDPGIPTSTKLEKPAIDTAALGSDTAEDADTLSTSEGDLTLAKVATTPKPKIFSRAQWGANENLRDKGALEYGTVNAGFVHHTVNANNYAAADVPAILRGIYAYHTQSRGWADIGYNFLVDRFGRIWEGRYGGVDRPAVGAHTLGYNEYSFAMSAIGNFDVAQPSSAMVQAYGALFAWKLSLHGVVPASPKQKLGSKYFAAINGHRDAGSTACPGRYLYAKLDTIRSMAKSAQAAFRGRQLESNLVGKPQPDIVVRRKSDGRAFVVPIAPANNATGYKTGTPINAGISLAGANLVMNAGDWDRDGFSDLIARFAGGALKLYRGRGDGTFAAGVDLPGVGKVGLLSAVGDYNGDGFPDLMGQPLKGSMRLYPGKGLAGVKPSYEVGGRVAADRQIAVGRWTPDGAPDTLLRKGATLTMLKGNGPGGIVASSRLNLDLSPYDWVIGVSDVGITGHPDLIVRAKGTGQLYLIKASKATFSAPQPLGSGFDAYNLAG